MNNITKQALKRTGFYREGSQSYYTVNYKSNEYRVRQLNYQVEKNLKPEEINCIIREEDGVIKITQDYAAIISELYKVNQIYTVKVRSKENGYYKVVEPNGLTFLLTDNGINLRPGQKVNAKVTSINLNHVIMVWVGTPQDAPLVPFRDTEYLRIALNLDDEAIQNLKDLLQLKSFEPVQKLYNLKDSRWLLNAIIQLDELLLGNGEEDINAGPYVDLFQKLSIYVLEESDILKTMEPEDRTLWITRLSAIAQHAADYQEAYRIIAEGQSHDYIERQLKNLQQSENLYQPERKFRIIMCIFNLNEELMNEKMDKIFDIIIGGDKEHWRAEPFRTAFVDMLELFISEHREKAIHSAETTLIHKMIKAIAIQQLLSKGEDSIDRRLNQATYYRLLSYIGKPSSEAMLSESFIRLFGQYREELEYKWEDVSDPVALYFRYSNYKKNNKSALSTENLQRQVYSGEKLSFIVDDKNLSLQPSQGAYTTIDLKGLVDWRGLELKANETIKLKTKDKATVKDLSHYWESVTQAMLAKPRAQVPKRKKTPAVGDRVWVKMVDDDENFEALQCEIVDDVYEGMGWLSMENVVKYIRPGRDSNLTPFLDKEGNNLLFEVEVIKDAGSDGHFELSMLPIINEYFQEKYANGDTMRCKVRSESTYGDYYVCVSEHGASCRVYYNEGTLKKDDVVNAVVTSITAQGQALCEFENYATESFSIGFAYNNLLKTLCAPLPQEEDDEEEDQVVEDPIESVTVKELIGILDRLSALSEDRIQSYSFLSVACLLAQMIEDNTNVGYYDKRKSLLVAFEDYEKNGYVDPDKLKKLIDNIGADLITTDYLVNESITKFKILDALKHKDNVATLFKIRQETTNTKLRNAADLAIALLLTTRFELSNVDRHLRDRINLELGIKVHTSTMRDFGTETQEMEFKSSVIYPAGNHMQPQREQQRAVIMQTICGFLNSDKGGTLYLGVNKDGGACGVENDLKFLNTDEDGYGRYIHGMINEDMDQIANQCCTECEWIEESGYKIYVMKIKPAPNLIPLYGEYWIRQDTEKRVLKAENIETYRRMHQEAYRRKFVTSQTA